MTKDTPGKLDSGAVASCDAEWQQHLAAARAGDSVALGAIVDQLRDYLCLVAERELDESLSVKAAPSDLVQQTMLEAIQGIKYFRGQSETELRIWLVRILRNNLVDAARSFRNSQRRDIGRELRISFHGKQLPASQRTASSIFRRVEEDEQLDAAIARLPDHYRTAVLLRHVEDLQWSEVGAEMQVSAEAARKLWARAIAELKVLLQSADIVFAHERANQATRNSTARGTGDRRPTR